MTEGVEVQGLSVRLGRRLALRDVSFALPEGASVAILGPNGGGKSTLLRALHAPPNPAPLRSEI